MYCMTFLNVLWAFLEFQALGKKHNITDENWFKPTTITFGALFIILNLGDIVWEVIYDAKTVGIERRWRMKSKFHLGCHAIYWICVLSGIGIYGAGIAVYDLHKAVIVYSFVSNAVGHIFGMVTGFLKGRMEQGEMIRMAGVGRGGGDVGDVGSVAAHGGGGMGKKRGKKRQFKPPQTA
jgi:hypothetical protein